MNEKTDPWKVGASVPREVNPPKIADVGPQSRVSSWWDDASFPEFGKHHSQNPDQWIGIPLLQKAFAGGPPVRSVGWEGNLIVPASQLIEAIQSALKCRLVRVSDSGNGNGSFMFVNENSMLTLHLSERGRYSSILAVSTDEMWARQSDQLFKRCILPDNPQTGLVYTIAQGQFGYSISRLGSAGTVLERGNYAPAVLRDYDHVVTDLRGTSPCGRLIILAGAPGTGKTFIVRSLLTEVPQAAYILVPPHLVEGLSGPELLPALTGIKNEFQGPIVLIIEDADKVLVSRDRGDMDAISSMLNLGDGILGAILDIRILATTNAKELEMDPATRRKGRLCRYIEVGPISGEQASKVYNRLTGKLKEFKSETTLAEIYGDAREDGWAPPAAAVPGRPELRKEIL